MHSFGDRKAYWVSVSLFVCFSHSGCFIPIIPFQFPCRHLSIAETAKAAGFFCSDGIIVTGKETGQTADLSDNDQVRTAVNLPILVGSGVTDKNISRYTSKVDAVVVGSHFKRDGKWYNDMEKCRVKQFINTWGA